MVSDAIGEAVEDAVGGPAAVEHLFGRIRILTCGQQEVSWKIQCEIGGDRGRSREIAGDRKRWRCGHKLREVGRGGEGKRGRGGEGERGRGGEGERGR